MTCLPHAPYSRRELLQRCGLGIGALALGDLLIRDSAAEALKLHNPLAPQVSHFPGTAKQVIFLFMQGGPSQVDTFDPKPALNRYDGQLLPESYRDIDLAQINVADSKLMASTIPFQRRGESGLEICDLFANLSNHADELAVIRSCYHESFIHGPAITLMHTGSLLMGHPSTGSWVAYGLGCESDSLPAFIAMTDGTFRGGGAGYRSGFLPAIYQGTHLRTEGAPIQNLARPGQFGQQGQRALIDAVNNWNQRYSEARPGDSRLEARIANYELAFRMQTAAPELIDIGSESQTTRKMYGIDEGPTAKFGRMCLLGRRMIERGVRFVTLISSGWDAHGECVKNHTSQCAKVDRPIAALMADLKTRGLLSSTLLVWVGEFGRTPIAQGSQGRDHHPYGFSAWMAGGGIQGGKVIGATDDLGFHAIEDRVHVNDLHATMLSLLGLDHRRLTFLFEGRERRLTDAGGSNDLASRLVRG